jgi:hypothetical protein
MFEVMNDESARRADRIDAGRWLADRGFGKAPVQTEIRACEHPSIDLSGFSPEDLEAMLAILERHDPGAREQAASGRIYIDVGAASITGYRQGSRPKLPANVDLRPGSPNRGLTASSMPCSSANWARIAQRWGVALRPADAPTRNYRGVSRASASRGRRGGDIRW